MSRRLIVTGSAAALALVLAAPTAAFADSSKGDPAGNNGTIKIDYPAPADSGHANRPHPGCAFQLRMFGFDDDQSGTITFTGQAPTKLGTLLTQHKLLSNDAAGGGKDVDEVYSYSAEQLGLIGTPQAKQGWHVKVAVDADNAPGGAKQKVFWLSCPSTTPAASAGAGSSTGSTSGAATSTGSTSGAASTAGTPTTKSLSRTTAFTGGSSVGAASLGTASTAAQTRRVQANALSRSETVTGFTGGSAGAAATATRPAAQNRGSALPFTGVALGTMLALGLGALAAGALAIRAGRRRTAFDVC